MAKNNYCKCGCGEKVAREFKQGHDVRYKAMVVRKAYYGSYVEWLREADRLNLVHKLSRQAQRRVASWYRPRDARGRWVSVVHIEAVEAWHNDEAGFTHSVLNCAAAAAIVSTTEHQDGFACSTCIHVETVGTKILRHIERAAEAARQRQLRDPGFTHALLESVVWEVQGLNLVEVG